MRVNRYQTIEDSEIFKNLNNETERPYPCYIRYRNIVSVGKSVCIKAGKDPHIFLLFTSMCSSKDCTYIINILCNRPLDVSLG